jgi:hypothetical protein
MSKWGSAATGALGGAATGASIGSIVPGIGTGIGAAAGGLVGGLSSLFGGKKKNKGMPGGSGAIDIAQLQNMTPEQMKLLQQSIGELGPESYLAQLGRGDEAAFAQSEEPAMRKFQELMGQNASRFSGLAPGALSARRSSGFQNSNAQATQDFTSQLRSQRMNLQQQAIKDLMGMRNELLSQKPYQYMGGREMTPNRGSFFEQIGQGLANQGLSQLGEYGAGKLQEQFKNWFNPATPNANPEA